MEKRRKLKLSESENFNSQIPKVLGPDAIADKKITNFINYTQFKHFFRKMIHFCQWHQRLNVSLFARVGEASLLPFRFLSLPHRLSSLNSKWNFHAVLLLLPSQAFMLPSIRGAREEKLKKFFLLALFVIL